MTAKRLLLTLTISLLTLLGSTAAAQAAGCDTWHGPAWNGSEAKSGEWGEKEDWSEKVVPVAQTPVCITVPGTYTVTLIPYPDTHYPTLDGGASESLTLGASNGTQTLKILGQGHDSDYFTSLQVGDGVTVGPHGVLELEPTEEEAPGEHGEPGGGILLETDTSGQPGHPFLVEGALTARTSSSKWDVEIHSHAWSNRGSMQVDAGTVKLYNEEPALSTGSITVAAGATLLQERGSTFTNEGAVSNSGTTSLTGFNSKGKWIQGSKGSIGGNPVVIEGGGGLEESAASGPGNFDMGANGGAYLLGTIPKGQTITFADATGQTTLFLGNGTLVNEGTLHLDLPAGDESNTNIEEGSIVNRGTIYGTVEGANAKNVIDVPLTNEPGAILAASSGTLFDNRAIANNGLLEIASGSVLEIVAATLTNAGTIAPQISGASTFGKIEMLSGATVEAAGTLAPTLASGFTPTAGEEFDVFEGTVKGAFAAVSGGFYGDYSHESASPSYVGVVYGAAPAPNPVTKPSAPPASVAGTVQVTKIASAAGKVLVTLSCPAGGSACASAVVRVTVTEHLKGGRVTAVSAKHGGKAKSKTKVVVIAAGSVTLAAGKTAGLTLALNATGAKLLKAHHKLQALVTVSVAGNAIRAQKVTISEAKAKKRK